MIDAQCQAVAKLGFATDLATLLPSRLFPEAMVVRAESESEGKALASGGVVGDAGVTHKVLKTTTCIMHVQVDLNFAIPMLAGGNDPPRALSRLPFPRVAAQVRRTMLTYKQLQARAKAAGIKANQKANVLEALLALAARHTARRQSLGSQEDPLGLAIVPSAKPTGPSPELLPTDDGAVESPEPRRRRPETVTVPASPIIQTAEQPRQAAVLRRRTSTLAAAREVI